MAPYPSGDRPNLLLFFSDDHAQWAAGCYGEGRLHTPNLDRLAREGLKIDRAYCTSPVCSPARASLYTGHYPSSHGIHDWLLPRTEPEPWVEHCRLLPEYLHQAGYETALVGKWHCGNDYLPRPGFDHWVSFWKGQFPHIGEQRLSVNGRETKRFGRNASVLTDEACNWLNARTSRRPWFLSLNLVDTHSPFAQQDPSKVEGYRKMLSDSFRGQPEARASQGWIQFGRPSGEEAQLEALAQYFAAVETLDDQIGRILQILEQKGILENTIIVYTSDHGHMNGKNGLYTKGNATVPVNFLEESIRVPLLIRAPGAWAPAKQEGMVNHTDLFQTFLQWAGIELPENLPGRSLLAATAQERPYLFCEYGPSRMVFNGRFKWIEHDTYASGPYRNELYDLNEDPGERHNRQGEATFAQIENELAGMLHQFFERHSLPGKSGREWQSQPAFNGSEPWAVDMPENPTPEGTLSQHLFSY